MAFDERLLMGIELTHWKDLILENSKLTIADQVVSLATDFYRLADQTDKTQSII